MLRLLASAATLGVIAVSACQRQPEPALAPVAEVPAPAAPVTPEQRRQELQVQSAENQIEAQLDAQAAPMDKSDH